MTISITYSVADNGTYDTRGRRQARVVESYEGVDEPPRTFIVPGVVVESFIRARRDIARRVLESQGYTKSEPPIDWSFLEKGTKQ
jgi:hypothetical protein